MRENQFSTAANTAEFRLTRRRGGREVVAGPGFFLRESERSSPGSTFMIVVVSSGGIRDHPAAQPARRGRLHPANADPPGSNHHIKRSLNTPRSLRSARDPEPPSAPPTSALSAALCELITPRLCVTRSRGGRGERS